MILTGEKAKYWEKKTMAFPLIYHKCHSGTKPGPQRSEVGDYPEPCMAIKD